MKMLVGFLLLVCTLAGAQETHSVPLTFKKDLIPEGIAIDPSSKKVYLNSLKKQKIVRSDLDGTHAEDFIGSKEYGYLSGFGMTIQGDTLFALGNSLPKSNNSSVLLMMNSTSREFIASYTLNSDEVIYLNDIATTPNGDAYITDSESDTLYALTGAKKALEVFFTHEEIKHSNGIAASDDGKYLYLATYTSGIRILDIASKKLLNPPNQFKGIDGMKFHKNTLIAIVNGKRDLSQNGVFQFELNPERTEILSEKKIMSFFNPSDIPTTFAIHDDHMYFVSDSQLDNFDQEKNTIIHPDQLKQYTLVRLKI